MDEGRLGILIKKYVKISGLKKQEVADACGKSTQHLDNYYNNKSPIKREFIEKFAGVVRISNAQKKELLDLVNLQKYKMGEYVYKILDELNTEWKVNKVDKQVKVNFNSHAGTLIMVNRNEIENYINFIIEYTLACDKNKTIYIKMQPSKCKYPFDLLTRLSPEERNTIKIFHIVKLIKEYSKENMDNFKSIVQLALNLEGVKGDFYEAFYYYSDTTTELFPNLILTDSFGLLISDDYNRAVRFTDTNLIEAYKSDFLSVKESIDPFIKVFSTEEEVVKYYYEYEQKANKKSAILKLDPCLLTAVPPAWYRTKIKSSVPNKNVLADLMEMRNKNLINVMNTGNKHFAYFSISGIEWMFQKRCFTDVDKNLIEDISEEEIKEALKYMLNLSSSDNLEIRFIEDKFLDLKKSSLCIQMFQNSHVAISSAIGDPPMSKIIIATERTILQAFEEFFFEYLPDQIQDRVKSKEETIQIIREKYL